MIGAAMTVFEAFEQIPYDFLEISSGDVYGNTILSTINGLYGVFKLRSGMTSSNNQEVRQSASTLHAHIEDYEDVVMGDIVGNGVRVDGVNYRIMGVTLGTNFDTGINEHYTFTLERAEFTDGSEI